MLTSLIVAIAFAIGIGAPHARVAVSAPAHAAAAHVSGADTSGGGPPTHP